MPPTFRIRPYKDFLTPALHRRFTTAAVALLGLCYVEALLIGQWNGFFWSWFPFGRPGIRTGVLFISAFSIFVLRVAQLHVGLRTTASGFQTFQQYALRFETFQTAGWYLFSAWLYSELYIFSAANDSNIKWITDAKNTERPRLNERPIYLMTFFLILAVIQTGIHLFYDYDRVEMPVTKTKPNGQADQWTHVLVPPSIQLKTALPSLVTGAVKRAFIMMFVAPIIYSTTIRQPAWSYTLAFAKLWWNLPRSTALPAIRPFHWQILLRSFTGGFMLIMMWEVGNAAFSAYVAQEPLKNERPITFESRDPNGSLLTGLRGKKLQTRAFAFWELVYIAQRFQGRRKVIFEDIDRLGGSTWSQILSISLETIEGINARITDHLHPTPPQLSAVQVSQDPGLPKLSAPLREDNIWRASPPPKTTSAAIAEVVGSVAKAHGQSPSDPLLDRSRKFIEQAKAAVLTPEQEKALSPTKAFSVLDSYAIQLLQSPVGWPFRQEFSRRMAIVLLGSPYGDVGIIVDAIDSLTRLAVCSLKEDLYGNVQRDVPAIIRTFTATIEKIEGFKLSLGSHWTDVEAKKDSPEADIILTALKGGLHELLDAFGDYSEDLRLSQNDMKMAFEAATPKQTR